MNNQEDLEITSDEDDYSTYLHRSPPLLTTKDLTRQCDIMTYPREQSDCPAEQVCPDENTENPSVSKENLPPEDELPQGESLSAKEYLPEVESLPEREEPEEETLSENNGFTRVSVAHQEPVEESLETRDKPENSSDRSVEPVSVEPQEPGVQPGVVTDQSMSGNDEDTADTSLRRSTRLKEKPRKLTYPALGNPLVSIVQSLFQSLSTAVSNSLTEPSIELPEVITVQPGKVN